MFKIQGFSACRVKGSRFGIGGVQQMLVGLLKWIFFGGLTYCIDPGVDSRVGFDPAVFRRFRV